jgi:DNA-binding transcriptional LysR family regulator
MDMKQAEVGLLLALDAVLEEGSVTAAARRMNISQPAFSAQLARLRRLFNDPLLVPSGRRLVPTTRARELQAPLRHLLGELDMLVRQEIGFDPVKSTNTFRLSATDYVHRVFSSRFARQLSSAAPKTRLALISFDGASVWSDLEAGRIDAAVVTTFFEIGEAKARPLFSERFVFVQRHGHPRGKQAPSLEEFCSLEHILVSPEGGGFVGVTDELLAKLKHRRQVVMSVPSFLLAPTMIAASNKVAVLPERIALAYAREIDAYDLPFELQGFNVQLVWHPSRQNDPAHLFFREQVKKFFNRETT